jgi:hypothetical protein
MKQIQEINMVHSHQNQVIFKNDRLGDEPIVSKNLKLVGIAWRIWFGIVTSQNSFYLFGLWMERIDIFDATSENEYAIGVDTFKIFVVKPHG